MGFCTRSTHYGIFTAAAQEVSVDDGHWVKVIVDDIAECRSYIASRTCDANLLDVSKPTGTKTTEEHLHLRQIKPLDFRLDHGRNISPVVVAVDFAVQEQRQCAADTDQQPRSSQCLCVRSTTGVCQSGGSGVGRSDRTHSVLVTNQPKRPTRKRRLGGGIRADRRLGILTRFNVAVNRVSRQQRKSGCPQARYRATGYVNLRRAAYEAQILASVH